MHQDHHNNWVLKITNVISGIIFVSLCFGTSVALAQVTIRGLVSEASNSTPLPAANVVLYTMEGETYKGVSTDVNGLFIINGVTKGSYVIRASFIGFRTFTDTLEVSFFTENLNYNILLEEGENTLDDIIVVEEGNKADVDVGHIRIDKVDIQRVPTPAGSGDLASYIQTLPGVVSTGDRGGNLFIRGGMPTENMTLIDGALVYQPFHIIGFFSVFPEEIVSTADFYAGGFGPKYSGRTSSVLDVKLRNGDLYKRNFSASLSSFLSQVYFETPLKKGRSSLMISARRSLIEESSELYGNPQPLSFNSQMVKLNKVINDQGSNCSALFMRTKDQGKLDYSGNDVFRWNNLVLGGKCVALSQESSVPYVDINLSISHLNNEVGDIEDPERQSAITMFHTQINIVQMISSIRLEYGFTTTIRWMNYEINDYFADLNTKRQAILGSGAYLQSVIPLGKKIELKPGINASLFLFRYGATVDPRVQVSYKPRGRKDEELSAVVGLYRQPISGIIDFRDAGSAFTLWTPAPFDGEQLLAKHAMVGWRQPIGGKLSYSVEGYMKWMEELPVSTWSSIAKFNTSISVADGNSKGVDVNLKYNGDVFYSTVGYGYVITEYTTYQELFNTWYGVDNLTYNPPHDRRHQLNAQMGFDFKTFDLNIQWSYGSGLPFTRPIGFDEYLEYGFSQPDVREEYGTPRIILDRPFDGRMPEYHRLNVSVEKSIDLNTVWMKLQAGAINTYDKQNIFYFDIYTQRRIDQLPFFPFASLKVESKR